jgi:hypothetical protein
MTANGCRVCYRTLTVLPCYCIPGAQFSVPVRTANLTLRCVEITQKDLQREFHPARLTRRHLIPLPPVAAPSGLDDADAPAVIRHLSARTTPPPKISSSASSCEDCSASAPCSKNHSLTPTPGYVNAEADCQSAAD